MSTPRAGKPIRFDMRGEHYGNYISTKSWLLKNNACNLIAERPKIKFKGLQLVNRWLNLAILYCNYEDLQIFVGQRNEL